jgi:uncharacterized protein (DUF697 family)
VSAVALGPRVVLELVREARSSDERPIRLGGARELVRLLATALRAGGEADAVDEHGPVEQAAAVVWVGAPDEETLRRAWRAHVPIVALSDGPSLPYVLDTDLVLIRGGEGLPVERVAHALGRVLGARGPHLAARLPVLRDPVIDELIEACARENGLVAASGRGADFPVIAINQLRLVLGVAIASGAEVGVARLPELAGALGAGWGSRRLARALLASVPVAGFALRATVAYAATRAVGEAARARFALAGAASVRLRS